MLRMLALGRSNREIGEALHLSPGTVKNYIGRLVDKLCVSNRAGASSSTQPYCKDSHADAGGSVRRPR
jgi:DNA-binding NarL/FixJ family response regulator